MQTTKTVHSCKPGWRRVFAARSRDGRSITALMSLYYARRTGAV